MAAPHRLTNFLLVNCLLTLPTKSQVFWYGDERAYLQPPSSQGFFDLAYIEGCSQGIESNAIPKYAYFGSMIDSLFLNTHAECLLQCLQTRRCKAANYFVTLFSKLKGYCELLSESQLDNPRKMRPFTQATYYDNIKCPENIVDEFNENPLHKSRPSRKFYNIKAFFLTFTGSFIEIHFIDNEKRYGTE
ncbi:unnamed protein product [Enterobius vermicularis]|uniref:Apple domain-containing protein n=1 Tax=Enterobius vermicularis TaxID=51028 RepID=A0A0N4VBZ0_ENTVE|nr:unnamed protein product [Enterobius vermicularis]